MYMYMFITLCTCTCTCNDVLYMYMYMYKETFACYLSLFIWYNKYVRCKTLLVLYQFSLKHEVMVCINIIILSLYEVTVSHTIT